MIEQKICGHSFLFYDSIEEIPITRFHKYSKYLLIEGGIGDSIADIDAHIGKILTYFNTDVKKAQKEVLNLRQNLYFVANEMDIHHKGFMFLTYKVDGKVWEDFSDNGIEQLYSMINGESEKAMAEIEYDVRNKIDNELALYFPNLFTDSTNKNYIDNLRRRALLQIAEIVDGVDNKEKIKLLTEQISNHISPKQFEGTESEEIKFDKRFEDMCLAISKEFNVNSKGYNVMEFYSAYDRLEKINEEIRKQSKKRR